MHTRARMLSSISSSNRRARRQAGKQQQSVMFNHSTHPAWRKRSRCYPRRRERKRKDYAPQQRRGGISRIPSLALLRLRAPLYLIAEYMKLQRSKEVLAPRKTRGCSWRGSRMASRAEDSQRDVVPGAEFGATGGVAAPSA